MKVTKSETQKESDTIEVYLAMPIEPNALSHPEHPLWVQIFELCDESSTGTLFLASDNNKPGQIVVEEGMVTAVSYAGVFGEDALLILSELPDIRFSYQDKMVYPVIEKVPATDTAALLVALGYVKRTIEKNITYRGQSPDAAEPEQPEAKTKTVTYRGQTVLVESDNSASQSSVSGDSETKKDKPVKMYRGRPVID